MFGLDAHAMHRTLSTFGEKSTAGEALTDSQSHPDVVDGHRVVLRHVDRGWYRTFFGQVIGFYRRPPLPVLQVAWPDEGHSQQCVNRGIADQRPEQREHLLGRRGSPWPPWCRGRCEWLHVDSEEHLRSFYCPTVAV